VFFCGLVLSIMLSFFGLSVNLSERWLSDSDIAEEFLFINDSRRVEISFPFLNLLTKSINRIMTNCVD
jgi:hypothetical protein